MPRGRYPRNLATSRRRQQRTRGTCPGRQPGRLSSMPGQTRQTRLSQSSPRGQPTSRLLLPPPRPPGRPHLRCFQSPFLRCLPSTRPRTLRRPPASVVCWAPGRIRRLFRHRRPPTLRRGFPLPHLRRPAGPSLPLRTTTPLPGQSRAPMLRRRPSNPRGPLRSRVPQP